MLNIGRVQGKAHLSIWLVLSEELLYESQFYPHSLWIVPHKTVRDYDRAISMGRNRAIYLEMVYEGERFIWHSYVMMI